MGIPDDMSHLTQPEPINHNELKRLLIECFDEVFNLLDYGWSKHAKDRVIYKIEHAILDGDDS